MKHLLFLLLPFLFSTNTLALYGYYDFLEDLTPVEISCYSSFEQKEARYCLLLAKKFNLAASDISACYEDIECLIEKAN